MGVTFSLLLRLAGRGDVVPGPPLGECVHAVASRLLTYVVALIKKFIGKTCRLNATRSEPVKGGRRPIG
jgi:hypothetical protein